MFVIFYLKLQLMSQNALSALFLALLFFLCFLVPTVRKPLLHTRYDIETEESQIRCELLLLIVKRSIKGQDPEACIETRTN